MLVQRSGDPEPPADPTRTAVPARPAQRRPAAGAAASSHRFAERMSRLRASTIREILKVAGRPDVISFAGGLPAPELFPTEDIAQATVAVMRREGAAALQYSLTEGVPGMRAWVARRLRERWQVGCDVDDVLITGGSQQALDLIGKVFLDPGDWVVVENPSYLGAIQAFDAYQARYLTVETDAHGLIPASLEEVLARAPAPPKLLYLVPNFQNPTGITLSAGRRPEVVQICERHALPIVEDDPYGELRFAGEPAPPLAAIDAGVPVLYCGTGSKITAPGLRVAWLLVRDPVIRERIVVAKQGSDLHTSTFGQFVFLEFASLEGGRRIDRHVETIRSVYGARQRVMLAAMQRFMPPEVRYVVPEGGMFFWTAIDRPGIDTEALLEVAARDRVAFVPGRAFYPNRDRGDGMRLNFSNASEDAIETGIERLARAIREFAAA